MIWKIQGDIRGETPTIISWIGKWMIMAYNQITQHKYVTVMVAHKKSINMLQTRWYQTQNIYKYTFRVYFVVPAIKNTFMSFSSTPLDSKDSKKPDMLIDIFTQGTKIKRFLGIPVIFKTNRSEFLESK